MIKGIIFDFMRTLYDPEKGRLFSGALPLLKVFKEWGLKLGLISFGGQEKRMLIESLNLGGAVDWCQVVLEKTPSVFSHFRKAFHLKAEEVLVVGDLVNQEIAVGKSLGMKTAWIKTRWSLEDSPSVKPDFVVTSVRELKPLVWRLLGKV